MIHDSLFAAASSSIALGTSPDAIGIRVAPNQEHQSPLVWYKKNVKLQGAPQWLLVDGYEAVRDGRTVYVNAANVDLAANKLYTNIYIISYNQDADNQTIDIFGQILAHWKFNINLNSEQKIKVSRDTKRLSDLNTVKLALISYQARHNGQSPGLAAGSYLKGKTISKWPSWQATLGVDLGITMPADPINKLGDCPADYDKTTCWDNKNKKFGGSASETEFILPSGSYAYSYFVLADGVNYKLCALSESSYLAKNYCLEK